MTGAASDAGPGPYSLLGLCAALRQRVRILDAASTSSKSSSPLSMPLQPPRFRSTLRANFAAASPLEDDDSPQPSGFVPGSGRVPAGFNPMLPGQAYRRGVRKETPTGECVPEEKKDESVAATEAAIRQAAEMAKSHKAGDVPPLIVPDWNTIRIKDVQSHCAIQAVMAVVGGAVMGVAFGTFMGTMDTGTGNAMLGGVAVEPGTTARQVLKDMVKSIRVKSVSYAKSFAWMGFLFAGSECVIEQWRGRTDMYNSLSAGCFTGATLAHGSGPKGMCMGCAGFAAFSALIDRFMGRH